VAEEVPVRLLRRVDPAPLCSFTIRCPIDHTCAAISSSRGTIRDDGDDDDGGGGGDGDGDGGGDGGD
jgi:hypothetical protein